METHKKFSTFMELNDHLLRENEHQRNRNIVVDQTNIIANILDGQRIVDNAKEYCRTILEIPEYALDATYHDKT